MAGKEAGEKKKKKKKHRCELRKEEEKNKYRCELVRRANDKKAQSRQQQTKTAKPLN